MNEQISPERIANLMKCVKSGFSYLDLQNSSYSDNEILFSFKLYKLLGGRV